MIGSGSASALTTCVVRGSVAITPMEPPVRITNDGTVRCVCLDELWELWISRVSGLHVEPPDNIGNDAEECLSLSGIGEGS